MKRKNHKAADLGRRQESWLGGNTTPPKKRGSWKRGVVVLL